MGMGNLAIQEHNEDLVFTAKIVPGSSGQTRICGLLDDMLKVKVSAAPEKGKANQCLIKFLAEQLGVKKNAVSIISG
ncbi:MAG TPA: YggU family protein, partial [Phycisphaerales bacterium]|nr:YggU family protein [Phycisphaerales bacterium]